MARDRFKECAVEFAGRACRTSHWACLRVPALTGLGSSQLHASASGLRKTNSNRLFRGSSAVFAFANIGNLFPANSPACVDGALPLCASMQRPRPQPGPRQDSSRFVDPDSYERTTAQMVFQRVIFASSVLSRNSARLPAKGNRSPAISRAVVISPSSPSR